MPKFTDKQYKKKAKKLKSNLLINHSDIDLRRKLTKADKSLITRRFNLFHEIATDRKQSFTRRFVSKPKAKRLKEIGYAVQGQRVWIPSKNAKSVHIEKNQIIIDRPLFTERVQIKKPIDVLKSLENNPKLAFHERITVQVGNSGNWEMYDDVSRLLNYIQNTFIPRQLDPNETMNARMARKDNLISRMSIVKINKKP